VQPAKEIVVIDLQAFGLQTAGKAIVNFPCFERIAVFFEDTFLIIFQQGLLRLQSVSLAAFAKDSAEIAQMSRTILALALQAALAGNLFLVNEHSVASNAGRAIEILSTHIDC